MTLRASSGGGDKPHVMHVSPTLTATYGEQCGQDYMNGLAVPVAFNWQGGGTQTTLGYDPQSGISGSLHVGQTPAIAWAIGSHAGTADGVQTNRSHAAGGPVGSNIAEECAYSLRGGRTQNVATPMQVRRLTPRECERLQGFPDDYTLIPLHNKKPSDVLRFSADGPRYKALGNSWAVPCARWIGQRINQVEALHNQREEIAA